MTACPPGGERPLTRGEKALAKSLFGAAINLEPVRIRRRKWFAFQPADTVMAPCGHIHFHPESRLYRGDFAKAEPTLQGLFMHELTHVWQAQTWGRFYLPVVRHPFCRYGYRIKDGRPFWRYGVEQQAEIVRHAFLARNGMPVPRPQDNWRIEALLPFGTG